MILADSSAWIELLRRTRSDTAVALRRHLETGDVATTDVVIAKILSGTTDAARVARWQRGLDACTYLAYDPYADAVEAARLYRTCRIAGETPRQITDCFVAAVALRHDVPVLHRDRDYAVLARHVGLRERSA